MMADGTMTSRRRPAEHVVWAASGRCNLDGVHPLASATGGTPSRLFKVACIGFLLRKRKSAGSPSFYLSL